MAVSCTTTYIGRKCVCSICQLAGRGCQCQAFWTNLHESVCARVMAADVLFFKTSNPTHIPLTLSSTSFAFTLPIFTQPTGGVNWLFRDQEAHLCLLRRFSSTSASFGNGPLISNLSTLRILHLPL